MVIVVETSLVVGCSHRPRGHHSLLLAFDTYVGRDRW
jgi:hypothetical protein